MRPEPTLPRAMLREPTVRAADGAAVAEAVAALKAARPIPARQDPLASSSAPCAIEQLGHSIDGDVTAGDVWRQPGVGTAYGA